MSDSFPSNSKNIRINCDVTIINSEFNSEIVNQLISTTENRLKEISNLNLTKISVPGAYEIPFVIKKIMEQKRTDAIICLGAIIRGDTTHYDLISENVFMAISELNNLVIVPIINGILTTEDSSQAKERIKNGIYFADTCLHMIKLNKDLT